MPHTQVGYRLPAIGYRLSAFGYRSPDMSAVGRGVHLPDPTGRPRRLPLQRTHARTHTAQEGPDCGHVKHNTDMIFQA
jgi:hypothetical protein